jgi:hypothetical protein
MAYSSAALRDIGSSRFRHLNDEIESTVWAEFVTEYCILNNYEQSKKSINLLQLCCMQRLQQRACHLSPKRRSTHSSCPHSVEEDTKIKENAERFWHWAPDAPPPFHRGKAWHTPIHCGPIRRAQSVTVQEWSMCVRHQLQKAFVITAFRNAPGSRLERSI